MGLAQQINDKNKIIIEGIDGTGKTTLAKKLIKEFPNHEYIHETNKTVYSDEYIKKYYLSNKKIIFDRSIIGEVVWPKIFNRKAQLSALQLQTIFSRMKKTVVIRLTRHLRDIKKTYIERCDKIDTFEILRARLEYDMVFSIIKNCTNIMFVERETK